MPDQNPIPDQHPSPDLLQEGSDDAEELGAAVSAGGGIDGDAAEIGLGGGDEAGGLVGEEG